MINLTLKTEYSFQQCFQHLDQITDHGNEIIGIADIDNTFGHIRFRKICKKANIKPVFGVRLKSTDSVIKSRSKYQTANKMVELILIAKNNAGLVELYKLVKTAYDQFYYFPRLLDTQIPGISKNIAVIVPSWPGISEEILSRADLAGLSPSTPGYFRVGKPLIAIQDNYYPAIEDSDVYELLASGKGINNQTYPQHVVNESEFRMCVGRYYSEKEINQSINNANILAQSCNADIRQSQMLRFKGSLDLKTECIKGAMRIGVDLDDPVYMDRLNLEIKLIESKKFSDYFFIVSDMLLKAKETMLVGPGRGSSGGSLVCYLMGITSIDPIKHGLLFARFIDINRSNFPDVDTDIPDVTRGEVIKYLTKKYGSDNVNSIGTISTYKPKAAIGDFAKALRIPEYETQDLKNSIIERSSGDARAALCLLDTLEGTEIGAEFITRYPELKIVHRIEGHARHSGKHAAGVIVSNDPLHYYGGINSRDSIMMMDHWESESVGLLKIDVLGLRTLSVLSDTAKLSGFHFSDFYNLSLDDKETFQIFNDGRLHGVFQFEGKALQIVTKQMGVESFHDLCAITSLGRPGALNSGGTAKYIKRRHGGEEIISYGDIYDRVTRDTYGIVIFQEQTMMILRELGMFSWENVNILRGAISKSYGDEFFAGYKNIFMEGADKNGYTIDEAEAVWKAVASMGSYGFNKSHAVAYSMISYWTAWCKAHYPLEFAAANLNHAKDEESSVKILRDFVLNDGIEYTAFDPDASDINWTIKDGKLLGGLLNLKGIGINKAKGIIKTRETTRKFTPAILQKLFNPETAFDVLFPTQHYFGSFYDNPSKIGLDKAPTKIEDVNEPGEYVIIGVVIERDLRDRNDVQSVIKRGGELVTENQFYLNLYIEDDTDNIRCMIPPFKFDELNGKEIAEKSIPGKTWYLIKGVVKDQWRSISIENILNINSYAENILK